MTAKMRQFIKGMGSAMDLGATPSRADVRLVTFLDRTATQALTSDWQKLAKDFCSSFSEVTHTGGDNVKAK